MAAATVRYIDVSEPEQMQAVVSGFVVQGFTVASQSDRRVTLVKRKRPNFGWVFLGLFFFMIPLLIYVVVYAMQSDQVIEVRLVNVVEQRGWRPSEHLPVTPDLPPPNAPMIQLSPAGDAWWDGESWRLVSQGVPPHAARHPDGLRWWDGQSWRRIEGE